MKTISRKLGEKIFQHIQNFRCNSLPLRAPTGRLYENIDYSDCKCLIYNTDEIED